MFFKYYYYLKLLFCSLFYNSLFSIPLCVDTVTEPFARVWSRATVFLGTALVISFAVLISAVVVIFYICLLPVKYEESFLWTCWHLIFGHWLLINVIFNYVKAAFTPPGSPSEDLEINSLVCKKCFWPKPPRTHHCRICEKCILKMDHHCPWLNNCVGHLNHRFFFLFLIYMLIGCLYVTMVAYPVFQKHMISLDFKDPPKQYLKKLLLIYFEAQNQDPHSNSSVAGYQLPRNCYIQIFHRAISFEFYMAAILTLVLFPFIVWHFFMISKGLTTLEFFIGNYFSYCNCFRKKKHNFFHAYDYGFYKNWIKFLGLKNGKTFFRHILFPSSHLSEGDGVHWPPKFSNPKSILVM